MVQKTNSFERYWKELKRRKVFSVVTTYAATAYIIIEVINNLAFPLNLPAWIATLVLIILVIGLPVVIILSWIFDFTPQGIKKTESLEELEVKEVVIKPVKRKLRASYVLNAILIIAVIVLAYPKIFKQNTLERLRSKGERIAVAVMPFQNMTNDTTWNIWQDGIQNELITSLTNSEELNVRQIESLNNLIQSKDLTNYASITPSIARNISQKLDANVFIYGSIKQSGATIRLNAQLIDSKTEDTFKSFEIDGPAKEDMIFSIIDTLKRRIKNFLIISKLEKEESLEIPHIVLTNSPEAYRYFILGEKALLNGDYLTGMNMASKAIEIDSNFIDAGISLIGAYASQGLLEEAKKLALKLYRKRDNMPLKAQMWINWMYSLYFETSYEEIKYLKQLKAIDDQDPNNYSNLGDTYYELLQYDKVVPEYEKTLEIYLKWDETPPVYLYLNLGWAYHKTSQYQKEKRLYKKAEKEFRNADMSGKKRLIDPSFNDRKAILSLIEGNKKAANKYIEKYISILKGMSNSEADIKARLAVIYSEAGILDDAEECYRSAYSLEPDAPRIMSDLAWFLIDKNRNFDEGLKLVNKALELSPDDISYLEIKGWGLYKQGRYKEALTFLGKADSLMPVYIHELNLHLEAAKKAVANQKNN